MPERMEVELNRHNGGNSSLQRVGRCLFGETKGVGDFMDHDRVLQKRNEKENFETENLTDVHILDWKGSAE